MDAVSLIPLRGMPEVGEHDDLAGLVVSAATESDAALREGDIVVLSSKVVSKSLGLWAEGAQRSEAIERETVRVVAERRVGDRVTQIVQAQAGPVMAAAGVDGSNTGGRDAALLLPPDPDAEAARLRAELLSMTGLTRLGVVLSDTAGRPWRSGQTDFALGAAGVRILDDLRGGVDADGRVLSVTARALGDELAAAADLVKGKSAAIPAAIVRGTGWALEEPGPGARSLIRVGRQDWFDYGRAEAVRAALGTEPGTTAALEDGIAPAEGDDVEARVQRAVAVAGRHAPGSTLTAAPGAVRVVATSAYLLGLAAARLQVALWGEGLVGRLPRDAAGLEVVVPVTDA